MVNQGRFGQRRLGSCTSGWASTFHLDEMSAAVGLAQLEKLELMLAERHRVAARYTDRLTGLAGVELPYEGRHPRSWFIYFVRLAPEIDRSAVIEGMAARGISTRPYLPAIHLQPEYRRLGLTEGMLPVTGGRERVSSSTLALPFFIQLQDEDIDHVCASLREVLENVA